MHLYVCNHDNKPLVQTKDNLDCDGNIALSTMQTASKTNYKVEGLVLWIVYMPSGMPVVPQLTGPSLEDFGVGQGYPKAT